MASYQLLLIPSKIGSAMSDLSVALVVADGFAPDPEQDHVKFDIH
jgi:hypothetical protein